jgi:hypothetical protein
MNRDHLCTERIVEHAMKLRRFQKRGEICLTVSRLWNRGIRFEKSYFLFGLFHFAKNPTMEMPSDRVGASVISVAGVYVSFGGIVTQTFTNDLLRGDPGRTLSANRLGSECRI